MEEENNGGNGENPTANGVSPSLPEWELVIIIQDLHRLKNLLHPVGWSLPAEELHGEVEGGVDEEVGEDEGEDVGGRVGKHNVAVWL